MAQSEPRRLGVSVELKPHAYDPATNPELFEGVVSRRVVAFLIDFLILSIPVLFISMFIFVIGIITFGLGFLFYGLLSPAMVIWAVCYYGMTLGGPASATIAFNAAITRLPVGTEPVKASLFTPDLHSAEPVSPKPVTQLTRPSGASGLAL